MMAQQEVFPNASSLSSKCILVCRAVNAQYPSGPTESFSQKGNVHFRQSFGCRGDYTAAGKIGTIYHQD